MSETVLWGSWAQAKEESDLAVIMECIGVKGPHSQVQE